MWELLISVVEPWYLNLCSKIGHHLSYGANSVT